MIYKAMTFAMEAHKGQVRKYTGEPYWTHLAQVAGLLAPVSFGYSHFLYSAQVSGAWLHDVMEDCGITYRDLCLKFNGEIANIVKQLSDLEEGSREIRKALSRKRLAEAPCYVQDIKVCDMISNTASIKLHDPKFAVIYLEEKRLLLDVLTEADEGLVKIAREMIQ